MPLKIDAMIGKLDSPVPCSGLSVPVTVPATRFVKHTGTPPADTGTSGPKKNEHAPLGQSLSPAQMTLESLTQRWLLIVVVLATGPLSAHVPQLPIVCPGHRTANVSAPPTPTGVSW